MLTKKTQDALRKIYSFGPPEDRIDLEFQLINQKLDNLLSQLIDLEAKANQIRDAMFGDDFNRQWNEKIEGLGVKYTIHDK